MTQLTLSEALKLFAPVLFVQFALDVYCIINILKKGVRSLNKPVWILIVLIIHVFGAVAFLALGRKRWDDDKNS
jgi:hypothetical protein